MKEKDVCKDYREVQKFLDENGFKYQGDFSSGFIFNLYRDGFDTFSLVIRDGAFLECSVQWKKSLAEKDLTCFQSFLDYLNNKDLGLFAVNPVSGRLSFTVTNSYEKGRLDFEEIMLCWAAVPVMIKLYGDAVHQVISKKITIVEAVKNIEDMLNGNVPLFGD